MLPCLHSRLFGQKITKLAGVEVLMTTNDEYFKRIVKSIARYQEFLELTAFMMYPRDKDQDDRREYVHKALIAYVSEQARYARNEGLDPFETNKALLVFFNEVLAAIGGWEDVDKYVFISRKEDFRQAFNERFTKGMLAGLVVIRALTKKISLNEAIKQSVDEEQQAESIKPNGDFRVYGTGMKMTEDNFTKNIWPIFKDVGHLWASLFHFRYRDLPYVPTVFIDFDLIDISLVPLPLDGKTDSISGYGLFKFLSFIYWGNGVNFKASRSGNLLFDPDSPFNPSIIFSDIPDPMTS